MKTLGTRITIAPVWALTVIGALTTGHLVSAGEANADSGTATENVRVERIDDGENEGSTRLVSIEAVARTDAQKNAARKREPWLGVFTEEGSEALAAQLGLDAGVGLVVGYVAPDSPAAKAGLKKNDVLVECEGQVLVHPAQLRKLVRMRQVGDAVKLVFYRAGKKQTVSVTLAKGPAELGVLDDVMSGQGLALRDLQQQLRDLPVRDALREQMESVKKSLKNAQIDQKKVKEEVRRSMEQARKALQQALRAATNSDSTLWPVRKALEELGKSGVFVDNKTTVTVRSGGKGAKSIVKTDDSGTIVIVCNPKPHLTAHDPDGKLLFDGEIETAEQRDQVPPELWSKVEPLLEKLSPKAEDEP
jgi:membrane-associated protease RseP (regulator of RpoE activity)